MPSLRGYAQCIGLDEDFCLLHDFFGLRSLPSFKELSVRQQMNRLDSNHFHVNVILVGSDAFSDGELDDVNDAVFGTREIYGKAGVGVGRVKWFAIPLSEARGHDDISSDDEAVELTNSWTVHNNGLDVFVVRQDWSDDGNTHEGLSDQRASCDKDAGKSMSGSVVSVNGIMSAITMAHEIGHDLGLEHIVDLDLDELDEATSEQIQNLMFPFATPASRLIYPFQVAIIQRHCRMRPGC
jgi:hypothetical protein